jgi:hypothetical protein
VVRWRARVFTSERVTAYVPARAKRLPQRRVAPPARHALRHCLSEDYLDPDTEVRLLEQAVGWPPSLTICAEHAS